MPVPDAVQRAFGQWVLGSVGSGVVAIDTRERIVLLNEGARRVLGGLDPAGPDVTGQPCREVLGAQPVVADLLVEALDSRKPLSRAELVLPAAEGRGESTIGFTLSPVCDAAGSLRGAVMMFRDLTPFERMDEQDRLRERLAALGQMAADLAHEIRNPLAGMQVIAGLLRRRLAQQPDERAMVEQIMGELDAVADTVTAALEFVRPLAPDRVAVEPVALVEEALATAQRRLFFGGTVERDFEAALPPVAGDPDQLRSVLTNLIVNAFESMAAVPGEHRLYLAVARSVVDPNARAVRLGADGRAADAPPTARSELVLEVADTGGGVPAQLRDQIFHPFFTTKQRGSGVGLANAQKVVVSHGGLIELDAPPGFGARFRIRLPLEAAAQPAVRRAAGCGT